jgi:hypothetical protein
MKRKGQGEDRKRAGKGHEEDYFTRGQRIWRGQQMRRGQGTGKKRTV